MEGKSKKSISNKVGKIAKDEKKNKATSSKAEREDEKEKSPESSDIDIDTDTEINTNTNANYYRETQDPVGNFDYYTQSLDPSYPARYCSEELMQATGYFCDHNTEGCSIQ